METLLKKGRGIAMALALTSFFSAVFTILSRIAMRFFPYLNLDDIGISHLISMVNLSKTVLFNMLPCILLLFSVGYASNKSKLGLFLLGMCEGVRFTMMVAKLFYSSYVYHIGIASELVSFCLFAAGLFFIMSDCQNLGIVKVFSVISAVTQLAASSFNVFSNYVALRFILSYETEPWVRLMTISGTYAFFAEIIAAVILGTLYLFLFSSARKELQFGLE